jgi:hypothetical protein
MGKVGLMHGMPGFGLCFSEADQGISRKTPKRSYFFLFDD